ncbi:MAG: type II and III secretion system protein family protein [Desulfobacterales bacterium]|nr:type II and III secretion system protein family protein [Desulfobacterales bacterium]
MFLSKELAKMRSVSIIIVYVLSILLLGFSAISLAADFVLPEIEQAKKLHVVVGKSIILKSPKTVKRVSIADPEIAAIIFLPPNEIYITGKASGITNLTLWHNKKILVIYDIEVNYDIPRLKQRLHEILPLEKEIRVFANHDSITLSGRISSAANLSQAIALAEAYAPKGKVRNLLEVAGVHQVMLEVKVAEMSKSVINHLGINFSYTRGGDLGLSLLGGLVQLGELTDLGTELLVSPAVNSLFTFNKGSATWTGFVDALKEDGLVKILAEPTLIALSGQTAYFLAGGEYPVPIPSQDGIAITYKPFGVTLSFSPTVLSEDKISIKVAPEVSELDFSIALQVGGYTVPGLSTRRASTVVELADGQSFAIAGLLKETVRDSMSKFPLLGDIPVLGALFRSRAFQKNETELIIIITPHLVKPLDPAKQTLPTDFYIEPDDTEIYILGLMEGWEKRGELDGEFGHGMPYPD